MVMKANEAMRMPALTRRLPRKGALTRILTMQNQGRNWESRKLKWGMPVWISVFLFLLFPREIKHRLFLAIAILLFHGANALVLSAQTNLVTPAQYLAMQPKPNFAPDSRLPHLAKWSWPLSYELRVEMATNWGYALEFGSYNTLVNGGLQKDLSNNASIPYKILTLISNFPGKFMLSVSLDANLPNNLSAGFWITNSAGYFVGENTNTTWLGITNTQYTKVVSPEAPYADLTNEAAFQTTPLLAILSNAPIAIILNGGERDLDVWPNVKNACLLDPRTLVLPVVTNAWSAPGNTNGMSWPRYIAQRKAQQLSVLTAAVRAAVPNRELYVFYNTRAEHARIWNTEYNRNGWTWEDAYGMGGSWLSLYLNPILDMPFFEEYYTGLNDWTNVAGADFNHANDLLTHQLNSVGYNLRLGFTNNYSWVCGGWSNTDTNKLADIPCYTGFLKCLYTAGMVGAVAGYFEYPTNTIPGSTFGGPGFDAAFPSNSPPHWLLQIMALPHVHALFSHLDNFLYNGDLLSGPQRHICANDQPAYEFTNSVGYTNARVLARKLRGQNQWIVTAWASDNISTNVTVTIPTIGALTVTAVPSASVYQVTMTGTNVTQTLLDEYGSFPGIPAPPKNLRRIAPQ